MAKRRRSVIIGERAISGTLPPTKRTVKCTIDWTPWEEETFRQAQGTLKQAMVFHRAWSIIVLISLLTLVSAILSWLV